MKPSYKFEDYKLVTVLQLRSTKSSALFGVVPWL